MEARKRSSNSSETRCKNHPTHRQSPGICSMCLRERLSKISSSSSRAVTNVSSSSSSSSISSVSSAYSSHNSSNASSYTASPLQNYRNRRKINEFGGKGYLYFLKKNTNKSRSMAFVQDDEKKKVGLLSKLIGGSNLKGNSTRMMHFSRTREMFFSRV